MRCFDPPFSKSFLSSLDAKNKKIAGKGGRLSANAVAFHLMKLITLSDKTILSST